ncbi:hypothetical protein WJX74_002009 [Apatococcus lobatus]|uniref:STI1/HOP DP domain-containing protein n=2 Tax=Apatococcus TaxID=904362 RepID=A0AAW1SL49_9CHLO
MDLGCEEEDGPPPLQQMAEQVSALRGKPRAAFKSTLQPSHGSMQDEAFASAVPSSSPLRIVSQPDEPKPSQGGKPRRKPSALKGGFLNSKPRSQGPQSENLPHIAANHAPSPVPAAFLLTPGEEEQRYDRLKTKLIDSLKPTPESIEEVMQSPQLIAGFDDPEVMAAVNAIAANPQAMHKYKGNAKVMQFYQNMGQMMAKRCNKLAKT